MIMDSVEVKRFRRASVRLARRPGFSSDRQQTRFVQPCFSHLRQGGSNQSSAVVRVVNRLQRRRRSAGRCRFISWAVPAKLRLASRARRRYSAARSGCDC